MASMHAGIVLCGGTSSRMGYPKATLPFGPELMLQRVVRLLAEVVDPVVVVAAARQEIPRLPADVLIVRDDRPSRGPLEGLRAGLAALEHRAELAYATGCDVPLLARGFVRRMIEISDGGRWQIVVPEAEGFKHPLSAVYAINVLREIEALLAADQLRPMFLFDRVATRVVTADTFRDVDPQLATLRNLNRPADYLDALQLAGFQAPPEVLAHLQF